MGALAPGMKGIVFRAGAVSFDQIEQMRLEANAALYRQQKLFFLVA